MCKVLNSDEQRKKYKNVLKNGQTYFSRCFVRKNNGGRSNSLSDEEMQETLAFAEEKGIDRSEVESVTVVYNDEMLDDYVIISQHALERLKERLGWNKRTAVRMVEKIISNGTKDREVKVISCIMDTE